MDTKKLANAFRRSGWVLESSRLAAFGLHPRDVAELVRSGVIERVSRGLYVWRDADLTEKHSWILVQRIAPRAVFCLLSALSFHELTTQLPREVWIAIDPRTDSVPRRRPQVGLRVMKFTGPAFSAGIEVHRHAGVGLRVYSVAKTVADCFKYRNKVGLDVALEALREGWREKRFTVDELMRMADVCRVANVIRPYMEALL